MPMIRPSSDLRNKYNDIAEFAHSTNEPVFITKNGYGDLVVMSIDAYEALAKDAHIDAAIALAEAELASGEKAVDARTALEELRRKHFG